MSAIVIYSLNTRYFNNFVIGDFDFLTYVICIYWQIKAVWFYQNKMHLCALSLNVHICLPYFFMYLLYNNLPFLLTINPYSVKKIDLCIFISIFLSSYPSFFLTMYLWINLFITRFLYSSSNYYLSIYLSLYLSLFFNLKLYLTHFLVSSGYIHASSFSLHPNQT